MYFERGAIWETCIALRTEWMLGTVQIVLFERSPSFEPPITAVAKREMHGGVN